MVLILDGSSEYNALMWRELGYLICSSYLLYRKTENTLKRSCLPSQVRISAELPSSISTMVNSIFFGALKNISILKKECEQ